MKYTNSLKRTLRDLQQFDFDKALKILSLRNSGYSFSKIGKHFGMSAQAAHIVYKKISTLTVAEAETLRRILNEYLD